MRIDYLRDGPSPATMRLREMKLLPEVRAVTSFLVAAAFVIAGGWWFEGVQVQRVRSQVTVLQLGVDRSGVLASRVRAEMQMLERWRALDLRMRAIRGSGRAMANRLTELANRLPAQTWLTGIAVDDRGVSARGRDTSLSGVSEALRGFRGSQLVSVHGPRERRSRIVDFEMRLPSR